MKKAAFILALTLTLSTSLFAQGDRDRDRDRGLLLAPSNERQDPEEYRELIKAWRRARFVNRMLDARLKELGYPISEDTSKQLDRYVARFVRANRKSLPVITNTLNNLAANELGMFNSLSTGGMKPAPISKALTALGEDLSSSTKFTPDAFNEQFKKHFFDKGGADLVEYIPLIQKDGWKAFREVAERTRQIADFSDDAISLDAEYKPASIVGGLETTRAIYNKPSETSDNVDNFETQQ